MRLGWLSCGAIGALLATACTDGGTKPRPDAATEDPPASVTYQRDLRAVVEANCVECHRAGGIGPTSFEEWDTVKSVAPAMVAAVMSGQMPPWPARDGCHDIVDARGLSDDVKQLFADWQREGFAEGDVADYVAPEARRRLNLGTPSLSLRGAATYTPMRSADTYRCFYVGTVDQDTYLTALDIVPGVASEVHHVQLHRVEPADAASVRALDEANPDGGYACSSAGVGAPVTSQNMFSYRPGALAVLFNEGDAAFLKGGSGLVLQIHYNTQFLPQGQEPEPDQTRVDMWTLPEAERPAYVIYRTGVLSPLSGKGTGSTFDVYRSSIPANVKDVIGESRLPMKNLSQLSTGLGAGGPGSGRYIPGEIVGVTPHAHGWATRMNANLRASTLSTSDAAACLVDVPKWNYEWQLDYMFEQGVAYGPEDELHVECAFDNTAENQPVVNGVRRTPAAVSFGENTLNEMCLHYLWLRFKYEDFAAALAP
jgi:mono/diheme cytochrome c family protein